jgi:hypothetical protein
MNKQKIFLYISDIASYIGQNKWDYVTPFERLWKRCDKDGYNLILESTKKHINERVLEIKILDKEVELLNNDLLNKKITKRQWESKTGKLNDQKTNTLTEITNLNSRVNEIDLNQKQKLEKVLGKENIESIESKDIETDNKKENVSKIIDTMQISDIEKKHLIKETESFINKTHGTLKEESAIEIYEKKFNIKLNTSQEFYKYRLNISNTSQFEWYVGGKVDGLYIDKDDKSKSYIVEVKNRTRGFFSTLRDYEKTQIQLYMHILDISFSKLVEKYNNNIRITLIYRDDSYIKDILTYLEIFINNFESNFINNNEKQRDFVLSDNDRKKVFLKKLYLNDITHKTNMKILEMTNDNSTACLIDDLD